MNNTTTKLNLMNFFIFILTLSMSFAAVSLSIDNVNDSTGT